MMCLTVSTDSMRWWLFLLSSPRCGWHRGSLWLFLVVCGASDRARLQISKGHEAYCKNSSSKLTVNLWKERHYHIMFYININKMLLFQSKHFFSRIFSHVCNCIIKQLHCTHLLHYRSLMIRRGSYLNLFS